MSRPGFWSALSTAIVAVVSLAVAITTPPRSGPNCSTGCIGYPYTAGAEFVPRDYWWMYPASLLAVLAILLVASVPHRSSPGAGLAGRLSRTLVAIAAGVLATDYAIQLTVVQPSLRKGETDGIGLVSQYNPHGIFIALENVGYLLLGLGLACAGAAMAASSRLEHTARLVFITGGAVTVAALAGFAITYRSGLDYRFEVIGIAIDWLVLIVAGTLLSLAWRRPQESGKGS